MIPEPDHALAENLFDRLRQMSFDGVGITRDTYGEGEQKAHDLVAELAREKGFRIERDAALNLYVTLPGSDPSARVAMTGSHLDSVPRGGNFDGAAGVISGLAVLSGWQEAGFTPRADTTVMVIRAEESSWFPVSYLGSRAAFGILPAEAMDAPRIDTQRPFTDHLAALGGAPDVIARGEAHLDPQAIACFIEVHIEQGPVLEDAGEPIALVTGIRGSFRYRSGHVIGRYAHSGATPRAHRRDTVFALADLVMRLSNNWTACEAEGRDLAVTFGRFFTDADEADFAKVPGRVDFSLDVRSAEVEVLALVEDRLHAHIAAIEAASGVEFHLGPRTGSEPALMDEDLVDRLACAADSLGARPRRMACGAGHDSAVFAAEGVPTAMIFVRNANGSHNPDEAMRLDDFAVATRLLGRTLAEV